MAFPFPLRVARYRFHLEATTLTLPTIGYAKGVPMGGDLTAE